MNKQTTSPFVRGGGSKPLSTPRVAPARRPLRAETLGCSLRPTCHAIPYHTIPCVALSSNLLMGEAVPLFTRQPGDVIVCVLCLCVRHGPHASQVRWLHGFRPGVDPGYGVSEPCL